MDSLFWGRHDSEEYRKIMGHWISMRAVINVIKCVSIRTAGQGLSVPMKRCLIRNKASRIGARPDWVDRLQVHPVHPLLLVPRADIIFLQKSCRAAELQSQPVPQRERNAMQRSRPSVGLSAVVALALALGWWWEAGVRRQKAAGWRA